jgi:hypothetical protein
MRPLRVSSRLLIKVSTVAALWLLCASVGYAAPAPRTGTAGRVCDPHATALRSKPGRIPKSFGGPLATPSKHVLAGLTDGTARIRRGSQTDLNDDDEAIQNDAPAARIDEDDRPVPVLRPLGVLHGPFAPLLNSRAFSPRSPRGPPESA